MDVDSKLTMREAGNLNFKSSADQYVVSAPMIVLLRSQYQTENFERWMLVCTDVLQRLHVTTVWGTQLCII